MRIAIVIVALILVVAVCAADVCCSMAKDRGRPTSINRIRAEMAEGKRQSVQTSVEGLERQIRGLRVRAKRLVAEGRSVEARQVTAEIVRLSKLLEETQRKR